MARTIMFTLAVCATAIAVAGPAGSSTSAPGDGGEVWVTSQGTHRLFILRGHNGQGGIATVELPAGTGPHLTTFSPDGEYAYVSGMGNGDLDVVRADDRAIVTRLNFGPAGTHQAKPSPDGRTLLVAQIAAKKLIRVAADTDAESWTKTGELALAQSPICTIFRDDGQRAYVSLLPSGIAIVDVATMTLVKTLATDGFVACGMVKSHGGRTITLASSGGGGHVYRLNTATDELDQDLGTLGAADWHSFAMSPNEKIGFGSVPGVDEVRLIDLTRPTATTIASLALDPTPGTANDQPDNMAVRGNTLYASLRASGKLAVIDIQQRRTTYIDLSPPAPFNPANCAGCAVHGIALRPDTDAPTSRIASPRPASHIATARLQARGSASDRTSSVTTVKLALRRRAGATCQWWTGKRLVVRACAAPLWFVASGQDTWSYRFVRKLRPGDYRLSSRATDADGHRESLAAPGRNTVRFHVS